MNNKEAADRLRAHAEYYESHHGHGDWYKDQADAMRRGANALDPEPYKFSKLDKWFIAFAIAVGVAIALFSMSGCQTEDYCKCTQEIYDNGVLIGTGGPWIEQEPCSTYSDTNIFPNHVQIIKFTCE